MQLGVEMSLRDARPTRLQLGSAVMAMLLIFSVGWGTAYHWNNGAASFNVAATTPTPPAGGAPKKVMPLGDSLTDGYNIPGGYRTDLWNKVITDGLSIDFVGSLTNGPASLPDRNHEGHSGWRIDEIAAEVIPWLTAAQPDIVLLMIGTNDMAQDYNRATAPDRLSALIDRIAATRPTAQVIVASIPRLRGSPGADWVQSYNATIPSIIEAKAAQGRRVSYVDVYGVVTDSDLHSDLTHLNASGNSKVANVWYSAIRPILSSDGSSASTPTATPTSTPPTPPSATAPVA